MPHTCDLPDEFEKDFAKAMRQVWRCQDCGKQWHAAWEETDEGGYFFWEAD